MIYLLDSVIKPSNNRGQTFIFMIGEKIIFFFVRSFPVSLLSAGLKINFDNFAFSLVETERDGLNTQRTVTIEVKNFMRCEKIVACKKYRMFKKIY